MSAVNIFVTDHAARRYVERVEPCSFAEARERILEHRQAIEAAANFGCEVVKLGTGARLVLDRLTVVTVYGAHTLPRQCRHSIHQPIAQGDRL